MKISDFSQQFPDVWGENADSDTITFPIPSTTTTNGRASLDTGFTSVNMTVLAAGGIPPFGQDFNGILKMLSTSAQNYESGNVPVWSSAFATGISGYPQYALVQYEGTYYTSSTDDNTTTPGASGSEWVGLLDGYALTDDTVAQDVNGTVIGVASLGWDTKNNEAVANDTAGGSHTFLPTSQASIPNGTETNIGNQQWQSFYINNVSGSGTQVTFPLEFAALPTILLQPTSELNTNLAITANPVPGSLTTSGFKVNINNGPGTASSNGCGLWVWAYGASK